MAGGEAVLGGTWTAALATGSELAHRATAWFRLRGAVLAACGNERQ